MLATSAKLYAGQHVRIPLRFESVRRREGSHRSATKAADENLFAGFQVPPLGVDLVVPTFVYMRPELVEGDALSLSKGVRSASSPEGCPASRGPGS
jgi:hypothetical protein